MNKKIIDLHCDTISAITKSGESLFSNNCHFDIKRANKAGIGLQFFALFTMPGGMNESLRQILKQIYKLHSQIRQYPDDLQLVLSYEDIKGLSNENKIGCLMHLEGADALGEDIEILYLLYELGLRSLALTWNNRNLLADGVGEDPNGGGISKKGRELINVMDELGIILDLAHASTQSYYEAMELYTKPTLVSHANAKALCDHRRNLDDNQLRALASKGGIIGINLVPDFIKQGTFPAMDDLLDHVVYIAEIIGVEYIALGSDFDGDDVLVMSGVEEYAKWQELLTKRGFNSHETNLILRENALRVIKAVL